MSWFGRRQSPPPEPAEPALYASELHGAAAVDLADYEQEVRAEEVQAAASRVPRRVAWWVTMVVMGLVAGGMVIAILRFVNGPVESKAARANEPTPRLNSTPAPDAGQLVGLHVQMDYPGLFDQLTRPKADAQALEQYTLGSKSSYRRMIAVDVRPFVASGQLSDDASYRIRMIKKTEYEESKVMIAGQAVTLMTKADGTEQTLFWPREGKLLTVSVTSTEARDNVKAFMAVITGSVRWRK